MVEIKLLEPKDNPFLYKNSRKKFSKRMKKLYASSENESDFRKKFVALKEELIDLYFIKDKLIKTSLFVKIERCSKMDENSDGILVKVEIEQIENKEMMLKESIKYKEKRKKNMEVAYKKLQETKYRKDKRVTDEMALLYQKVLVKMPLPNIPNPQDMLDDMDKYKTEYYKYLLNIIRDDKMDPYSKDMLLNNVYTEYMSYMTKIPVKIPKEISEYYNTAKVEVEDVDEHREILKNE